MASSIETSVTNWLLGLLSVVAIGTATLIKRLFSRVRDLEEGERNRQRMEEESKNCKAERRAIEQKLFDTLDGMRETLAEVRENVAAIRNGGARK